MLNKIILKGNLGRDPEIQVTQAGKKVARFSLATSTSWKNEANEWVDHTDWHTVIVYRESAAEWIKTKFRKGDTVYVEGSLKYRYRKDKHGNFHWKPYVTVSEHSGCVEYLRSPCSQLEEDDLETVEPENLDLADDFHTNPEEKARDESQSTQQP
jgi:single-strand DNA-binding protein